MSGGSYNYLYSKTASDLLDQAAAGTLEDIRVAMLAKTVDKVYPAETRLVVDEIADVQQSLKELAELQAKIDQRLERIAPVLREVEWHESLDSGKEGVEQAVKNYILARFPVAKY
jgi:hypothetical protein